MRAGSTTRFVGIVVGGGSPFSPEPQFSDAVKIACNVQKTLARAPRFRHGPSQDAARCRSRQARGTSLTNRGLLTEETMTAHVAAVAPIATAKSSSVRWKIFLLMLFLISINYIDRASLSVAMPLIAKEFNLDPAAQGVLLSSFFWTYAFMQVPGGMLADRFKPRIVIALATLGWGFFQAIAAVAHNFVLLVLTRLGLGASEAPIYPAGGKLNAIWMTQNERARGAVLLDGGAPLGAAFGPFRIACFIAVFNSWRPAFVVAGGGTILCGLWAWYYIRNAPREHPSVNEAEARYIEQAHALEDAATPAPSSGASWLSWF